MDLEKFINENRSSFDELDAPAQLWNKISNEIKQKPKSFTLSSGMILRIAATAVFLIGIGYFAGKYGKSTAENSDLVALNPSYAKQVVQYSSFVNDKREAIENLKISSPELIDQFQKDWIQLDQSYQTLKSELPNNPNQEELVKAMIQNLQWQLEILNQQLEILEKLKQTKNGKVKELV